MQGHIVKLTEGEAHRMLFKKLGGVFFNKEQLYNQWAINLGKI